MATTAEQTLTGYDMMRATRHWSDCVDALQTEIAEKQRQLEQAQRNVNICQQAIDLCRQLVNEPNPAYGSHGHIRPSDLSDCKTQMEAAKEIARRSGNKLRLAHAAPLMFDTGKWNSADSNSLKRSLHGQLNLSEEWEREGERTGVYRLVECTDAAKDENQIWPPEQSSATINGNATDHASQGNEAAVTGQFARTA